MGKLRIQKWLSQAGVASRRAAEEMILEGRVSVNGEPVTELPCFVTPGQDDIRIDGKKVRTTPRTAGKKAYVLLNKPRGVVCTQSDPHGRPRAVDMVPEIDRRIYCAGRLDLDSTGLIVLTNDGDFCNFLTHPRYEVEKTYVVEVDGEVAGDQLEKLKKGMYLDGKRTQGAWVKALRRRPGRSVLEIKLTEGRNREIRRLMARLGHEVRRLKRTAIGPITDRGLKIGHHRFLTSREIRQLRQAGTDTGPGKPRRASGSRRRSAPKGKPPKQGRPNKEKR